jgi:hypothetical protein
LKTEVGRALRAQLPGALADILPGIVKDSLASQMQPVINAMKEELAAGFKAALQEEIAKIHEQYQQETARLRSELEAQQNVVAQLQRAFEDRERQDRAKNLVIYGLSEATEGRVEDAVAALFPGGSTHPIPIQEARRLGKPREDRSAARPRPVLVRFHTLAAKHAALKYSKDLRAHRVYLDADLTPHQRDIRRMKQDRFQELKGHSAKPFWRGDRLFYYQEGVVREDGTGPRASQA